MRCTQVAQTRKPYLASRDAARIANDGLKHHAGQLVVVALEHIFQVRALLTPEQQQRHIELVRQQLTGACPMRLHRQ